MIRHRHGPRHSPVLAEDLPVIALVGRPNVGKSTFMARASRSFVETANAPGTTIVLEQRRVEVEGQAALLVDLPGSRSLVDQPAGDQPFWQLLLEAAPDAILVIADSGDMRRHLPLALACRDLGLPIVVAANLRDEAERHGIDLDAGRLSQLLVAPVVMTSGRTGEGVAAALSEAIARAKACRAARAGRASPRSTAPAPIYSMASEAALAAAAREIGSMRSLGAAAYDESGLLALVQLGATSPRGAASIRLAHALEAERWDVAGRWAAQVERRRAVRHTLADRLSTLTTSPWPGLPLLLAVTATVFLLMVAVGGWLSGLLGEAWATLVSPTLVGLVHAVVPWPALAGALLWAIDGGLLAMLAVGIPYVLLFYLLLAALEDSGYLTSAAVLMDRVLNVMGLPGRATIPLLSAAGCNVPALYATRVLATRRERLLASWLVTLTPCSARTAVVIAALAPLAGAAGVLGAFALVAGLTFAAGLAANALVPGRQSPLVLELAPLRVPVARHVLAKAWQRFRSFVVVATPIMVVGSFILGLLYESGLWTAIAAVLEPLTLGLLGLPAIAGIAMCFAFLRKELALQLLVALAVVEYGALASTPGAFLSTAQVFVFAVVTCVSIPCAATLAALAAEMGWRAATAICGASLGLALGVGAVLARVLGIA